MRGREVEEARLQRSRRLRQAFVGSPDGSCGCGNYLLLTDVERSGQSSPAPVDHSSPASSRQPPIDAQPPTVRAAPILAHRPHRHSSHIVCPPPRRWTPSHRTLLTAVSTAVRPHRWIARLLRALVLLGVGGAKTELRKSTLRSIKRILDR